jgi:hypothetical protein
VANRELPDSPDFVLPKKPLTALTIRELRELVSARHKYLLTTKPIDEAIELLQDETSADDDSCLAFVTWLRGGAPAEPVTKGAVERIHKTTNPETGTDTAVETQPGSIPPRPI